MITSVFSSRAVKTTPKIRRMATAAREASEETSKRTGSAGRRRTESLKHDSQRCGDEREFMGVPPGGFGTAHPDLIADHHEDALAIPRQSTRNRFCTVLVMLVAAMAWVPMKP